MLLVVAFVGACTTTPSPDKIASTSPLVAGDPVLVIERITWGANPSTVRDVMSQGLDAYLRAQLQGTRSPDLPDAVRAQIDAMTIEQVPAERIAIDLNRQRLAVDATKDDGERDKARTAYQQELVRLGREAMTRTLLRAVYSPNQLREQMTWFWFDHFNVNQNKNVIRALIGDYEDRAIRRHALGRFRDMLGAVARHPAMLIYLDNAQNASGRINENFARELMELHTLGVNGGYTQADVQELARVLTGVGVNLRGAGDNVPRIRREVRDDYLRIGGFEFNPNRHDYGDKILLGHRIKGGGLREIDEALDVLARHPATARFVSRKLATYFVSDAPPGPLVDRMADEFTRTDGDIAATASVMFRSPEFAGSLGGKFKDPMHYIVSAVRLAYDAPELEERPIVNALPMIAWLNRMGQPLFGRQTPDGYPLTADAWTSPAQLTTRFEVAKALITTGGRMFRADGVSGSASGSTAGSTSGSTAGSTAGSARAVAPQLSNAIYRESILPRLSVATRSALDEAPSRDDWNVLLLASPEFQLR